jgi:hypothetical protein
MEREPQPAARFHFAASAMVVERCDATRVLRTH